jgi:hypothetical protein
VISFPRCLETRALCCTLEHPGSGVLGLACADVEDPGDLLNPDEQIPCIARHGIRRNPRWDVIHSRGDGHLPGLPHDEDADAPEQIWWVLYHVDEAGFNIWLDSSRLNVVVAADFEEPLFGSR